jgi:hypothetical protein
VQLILAIARASDFHLTAVKFSFADNANTLVIRRLPASESIFGAQDREAIIEVEMGGHNAKAVCSLHRKRTIGALDDSLDDCVIG